MNEFDKLIDKYKKEIMSISNNNTEYMDERPVINSTEPTLQAAIENTEVLPENEKTDIAKSDEIETLEVFLKNNAATGILKVQVIAAQQVIPIIDARVSVSKKFKDQNKVFYNLKTDVNGIIDGMVLYAKEKGIYNLLISQLPYVAYDVSAEHPDYETVSGLKASIWDSQKSILVIRMIPKRGI